MRSSDPQLPSGFPNLAYIILIRILPQSDPFLKTLLEEHHYYFNRSAVSCSDRICQPSGSFDCEEKYDQSAYREGHSINPYDNAESRILFSTWNLDHVVERSVLLSELSKKLHQNHNCIKSNKDVRRYYDLLFTRKNLKLVHKTCHVIGPHINVN